MNHARILLMKNVWYLIARAAQFYPRTPTPPVSSIPGQGYQDAAFDWGPDWLPTAIARAKASGMTCASGLPSTLGGAAFSNAYTRAVCGALAVWRQCKRGGRVRGQHRNAYELTPLARVFINTPGM